MNKILKKTLSLVLGLALILSTLPVSVFAGDEEEPPKTTASVKNLAELNIALAAKTDEITITANITLTSTLNIAYPVKLIGSKSTIRLSGNNKFTLINVGNNNFSAESLIFRSGNAAVGGYTEGAVKSGGAVSGQACDMTFKDCQFINNTANGNGGAIYCWGQVSLEGCTINNGTADQCGGGVYLGGQLTVKDTTIKNCTSGWFGGAIYSLNEPMTLENSTFQSNKQTATGGNGGAIHADKGAITIKDCIFDMNATHTTGFGAAIYSDKGAVTTTGTTFSGNKAQGGACIFTLNGAVKADLCTLSGNVSTDGYGDFVSAYAKVEVSVGASTETELIAAVNAKAPAVYLLNDITLTKTLVTKAPIRLFGPEAGVKLSGNNTFCLINFSTFAIELENLTLEGGNGASGSYMNANGGALSGNNAAVKATNCTFQNNTANDNGGAIYTWATANLTKCHFIGNTSHQGGAILAASNVTIEECDFTNNVANWFGGAVYIDGTGTVTVKKSTFTGNSVTDDGAGGACFCTSSGSVTLSESTFSNNISAAADAMGGVVSTGSGAITVTNCTFNANQAGTGGCLYTSGGLMKMTDCVFTNNVATWGPGGFTTSSNLEGENIKIEGNVDNGGAGVFCSVSGTVNIIYCVTTFTDLKNAINAGSEKVYIGSDIEFTDALQLQKNTELIGPAATAKLTVNGEHRFINAGQFDLKVENLTFEGGKAKNGNGGAILLGAGKLTAKNCIFDGCTAAQNGGAVFSQGAIAIDKCQFLNGLAVNGGAVYTSGNVTVSADSAFKNNTAEQDGGAIYLAAAGTLSAVEVLFESNSVGSGMGLAIAANTGKVKLTDCTVQKNYGKMISHLGGAIATDTGEIEVINGSFTENDANAAVVYAKNNAKVTMTDTVFESNRVVGGESDICGTTDVTITSAAATFKQLLGATRAMAGMISLTADVVATETIQLFIDTILTGASTGVKIDGNASCGLLNLGDYDLTMNKVSLVGGNAANGAAVKGGKGSLTISNAEITDMTVNGAAAAAIEHQGPLTLDTITFKNITNNGGLIKAVSVTSGSDVLIQNCQFQAVKDKVVFVSTTGNVTVSGSAFTDAGVLAIDAAKTAKVTGCTFSGCTGTNSNGGALYFGTVSDGASISDSYFSGCSVADNGGAVYVKDADLQISGTTFDSNSAVGKGGAVYSLSGDINAMGVTLSQNVSGSGEPIYSENGDVLMMTACMTLEELKNAVAAKEENIYIGQDINLDGSIVLLADTNFIARKGGAKLIGKGSFALVKCEDFDFTATEVTFTAGADTRGGAIQSKHGKVTLNRCVLTQNSASLGGSAIFTEYADADIVMDGCEVTDNTQTNTGAVTALAAKIEISDCKFDGNTSNGTASYSACIYSETGSVTVSKTSFTNNKAAYGAAIATKSAPISAVLGVVLKNNVSTQGTAPIWSSDAQVEMAASVSSFEDLDLACQQKLESIRLLNDIVFQHTIYTQDIVSISASDEPFAMIGDGTFALFNVGDHDIMLQNVKLQNGNAAVGGLDSNGGAIAANNGSITAVDVEFSGNIANNGAAISTLNGNVGLTGVKITKNAADHNGAVYALNGKVTVDGNAVFTENTADEGAAIYAKYFELKDSAFSGNKARNGGAVCNTDEAFAANVTFYANESKELGGAWMAYGDAQITACKFDSNISKDSAGALYSKTALNFGANTTLVNNAAVNNGGAILSLGAVNLNQTKFDSNKATGGGSMGGAIYVLSGVVTSQKSTFLKNVSDARGGAIYVADGNISVNGSGFNQNTSGMGGGVFVEKGTVEIGGTSEFLNNEALVDAGGAFAQINGKLTVTTGVTMNQNKAKTSGGAIILVDVEAEIDGVKMNNNIAGDAGGALFTSGKLTLKNSTLNNNEAVTGGAFGINTVAATMSGNTLAQNKASELGGAIYSVMADLTMDNDLVYGNNAKLGGGIYMGDVKTMLTTDNNTRINKNTASDTGAGLFLLGSAYMHDAHIDQNVADYNGGGIYCGMDLTLDDCRMTGDQAISEGSCGAGIYMAVGTLTLIQTSIWKCLCTNGNGGAIYIVSGKLVMESGTFQENQAALGAVIFVENGEVSADKIACRNNTALIDAGGAVVVLNGTLNLTGSVFENNQAKSSGGAVLTVAPTVTNIKGCTFKNNLSEQSGGAIFLDGENIVEDSTFNGNKGMLGGGVGFYTGKAILRNNLITDNEASELGGGVYVVATILESSNNTISRNKAGSGGAIFSDGEKVISMNDTMGANTVRQSGGGICTVLGAIEVIGSNISNNTAGENGGALYTMEGDILITKNATLSINKAYLGGAAFTTSGAIKAQDSTMSGNKTPEAGAALCAMVSDIEVSGCTFQGNRTETNGGAILSDTGNVRAYNCYFKGNVANDTAGAMFSGGALTAVYCTFDTNKVNQYGGALCTGAEKPMIVTDCTFVDNWARNGAGAIFVVWGGLEVTNSTFERNVTTGSGGAIFTDGPDTNRFIRKCTFTENRGKENGGAILNVNAPLLIENCKFTKNEVTQFAGGAVYTVGGELTLNKCSMSMNKAKLNGGAVYADTGDMTLNDCTMISNEVTQDSGGALCSISGNVTTNGGSFMSNVAYTGSAAILVYGDLLMKETKLNGNKASMTGTVFDQYGVSNYEDCVFTNNTAYIGGVCTSQYGDINTTRCEFSGNQGDLVGGGFYTPYGTITVRGCNFDGNKAYTVGGVIYNERGPIFVYDSNFTLNSAASHGGVIFNLFEDVTIENCTFSRNDSSDCGGIVMVYATNNCTVKNSTFENNNASGQGGAIYGFAGLIDVSGSTFIENKSEKEGGAICNLNGRSVITNCKFDGNVSEDAGGALYSTQALITGSEFTKNDAANYGSAICNVNVFEMDTTTFADNRVEPEVVYLEDGPNAAIDENTMSSILANDSYFNLNGKHRSEFMRSQQSDDFPVLWVAIGGGVVVLAAVAVVLILVLKKKKIAAA